MDKVTMRTYLGQDELEQDLQNALNHLYDPAYSPPIELRHVLSCESDPGAFQASILRLIQTLAPPPETPPAARSRRLYDVLACRYIQKLTQEETAERLGITPRHLRREQAQAIHVLAQRLWENYLLTTAPEGTETRERILQVRQELNALERGGIEQISDVRDTIERVVELVHAVASKRQVTLAVRPIPADLSVAIHPSELRQILVRTMSELVRRMAPGQVEVGAEQSADGVTIRLVASTVPSTPLPADDLVQELLAAHNGTLTSVTQDEQFTCVIHFPHAVSYKVLVVDDNADLIHFYRRYVQGTRYHIVPVREGARALETIQALAPDVIVLDVMLPDADGWELLSHLHNHPATRAIPIIVCSVVREEELALALGAKLYVPKPVRRQEFIQALDRALGLPPNRRTVGQNQVGSTTSSGSGYNAVAD
jgi:CheY-like chemotaxis protein/transcriptional regulator with XRE-family HTH domain